MKGATTMGSIASIQAGVAYQYPREREGCQSCRHVVFTEGGGHGPYQRGRWECGRYGFYTAPLALCSRHEPKGQEGGAV